MKKREINSTEIARLAGVSRSTVSRVINNYPNVPARTKEKVMKIIQENNYYPDLSGQVLAGKNTRTVGLFMIEAGQVSSDMISNLLLASIIETASARGYYILTQIIRNSKDAEKIRSIKESFYQRRIDGGIFIGAANHEPFIEELIAEGFIVGIVDQDLPGRSEPNRIVYNFDNYAGAVTAVDYLVSLGHKKIGVINGDMKRFAGPAKYNGYLECMKKHGLSVNPAWVLQGDFNEMSGYTAVKTLLKTGEELPTAFFAANDSVAFGAIRALNEHQLQVPDDLSVIGFDDHSLSSKFKPALSTVRIDFAEMMEGLTNSLIDYIEKGSEGFKQVTVGTSLIVRDSCRSLE